MHGFKLIADVLKEVLARSEGKNVEIVRLTVGENCHARPDEVEFLFSQAARGTRAETAKLEIKQIAGDDLVLDSIRVE
jgi:Zn finger protein HypA/HybF involved in hydrogenase expression